MLIWVLIAIGIINLILLFILLLKGKQGPDFLEKLISLRTQLDSLPELLHLRVESAQSKNTQQLKEDFSTLRETLSEKLTSYQKTFSRELSEDFESLRKIIEQKLETLSIKVQENLDEGFKNTNKTFQNVIERLAKIDEAQKKIDSLSQNVVSLQDVLTDKKSRGIFGEVHLKQILTSVFGEKNDSIYQLQFSLSNQKIVDAVIFLPAPIGCLSVDSKFPLENYKKMMDREQGEETINQARKEFSRNMKKHIDDINSKYIIPDETADQAILFLPAEAIFAEVHAYFPEIIDYANSKRVWLTSPTTFLATLTTVQMILLNLERNKYMNVIHEELNKLGQEFSRYQNRWDNLAKHIETVSKDVKEIHTTSQKISSRFESIKKVEIEGDMNSHLSPKNEIDILEHEGRR